MSQATNSISTTNITVDGKNRTNIKQQDKGFVNVPAVADIIVVKGL